MTRRGGGDTADTSSALIIADDLTGALDTAGCFASPAAPFEIALGTAPAKSARIAVDTDSRDLAETDAVRRVEAAFGKVCAAGHGLAFKKVDSVLRGHPVAEAVAMFRAGRFDRALFAPAFPEFGRMTEDGQHYVVSGDERRAVGPNLVEAFQSRGLKAARLAVGADLPSGVQVFVADASSTDALAHAAARCAALPGRTLHVGSAGLASALAGGHPPPCPAPRIDIAFCGTRHPATVLQVERARQAGISIAAMGAGLAAPDADRTVFAAPDVLSERQAQQIVRQSLAEICRTHPAPRALMATGGWTLRTLLTLVEAQALLCLGLHAPGIPVSRIRGGRWDGAIVVSKSGGFGGSDFLVELFATP